MQHGVDHLLGFSCELLFWRNASKPQIPPADLRVLNRKTITSLRLEVHQLVDVCARKIREQTQRHVTRIDEGITPLILNNSVGLTDYVECCWSHRKDRMDKFNVMSINNDRTLLIGIRAIADIQPKFFSRSPEQILGRVLVLVNSNEVFRDCIDGYDRRICEHGITPYTLTSLLMKGQYYVLIIANEASMPICFPLRNGK